MEIAIITAAVTVVVVSLLVIHERRQSRAGKTKKRMTLRSTAVLSGALVAGACTQSIAQLEPTRLQSARPGTEVVQLAVRELTGLGFEIVAADAASGVVTARRVGRQRDLASLIRCIHRHDGAELTISVSARPAAAGSEVVMSSRVTDRHTHVGAPASEDHDACASSGEVERRIGEAVSGK